MQRYSYTIQLRIWHPALDPAIITGTFGMQPHVSAKVGEPRRTPKGKPLSGTHTENYWSAVPFDRHDYLSTDDVAEDCQR
jgi:hypothetical protein